MIGAFLNYMLGIINGTFNLMGSMYVADTGLSVLSIFVVSIFVALSLDIVFNS